MCHRPNVQTETQPGQGTWLNLTGLMQRRGEAPQGAGMPAWGREGSSPVGRSEQGLECNRQS